MNNLSITKLNFDTNSEPENSLFECLNYCDNNITADTKKPFRIVVEQYDLYKKSVKAEQQYYKSTPGYEETVKKSSFKPLTLASFYRRLKSSTREIINDNNPLENLYALRYE
jgi:hypothetical protein